MVSLLKTVVLHLRGADQADASARVILGGNPAASWGRCPRGPSETVAPNHKTPSRGESIPKGKTIQLISPDFRSCFRRNDTDKAVTKIVHVISVGILTTPTDIHLPGTYKPSERIREQARLAAVLIRFRCAQEALL